MNEDKSQMEDESGTSPKLSELYYANLDELDLANLSQAEVNRLVDEGAISLSEVEEALEKARNRAGVERDNRVFESPVQSEENRVYEEGPVNLAEGKDAKPKRAAPKVADTDNDGK